MGTKNDGRPTLRNVAQIAGVSAMSVSNYLRGYPYMKESTKKRIQDALDTSGYTGNDAARNLRVGRTGLLSLSIPDLNQIYYAELAEEIIKSARGIGYNVIIESTGNDRTRELSSVKNVTRGMVDGLIIKSSRLTKEDIPPQPDFPLVVLDECIPEVTAPRVEVNNVVAGGLVAEHLIKVGCSSIMVIGCSLDHPESQRYSRVFGFMSEMRKRSQIVDPRYFREVSSWTSEGGANAINEIVHDQIHFDAVFALNDLLAWGCISRLKDIGLSIPADVRVVGFDDLMESRFFLPSLTTVDPRRSKIAETAVQSLAWQIDNQKRDGSHTLMVECAIRFRDSSPAS